MSIIIISSDSLDHAEQIAKGAAEAVGYQLLGPDLLGDIAAAHKLPVEKLQEALGANHSKWRRMRTKRRAQLLACIEAEVLSRLMADRIVCWGLAAHLYVEGVSHALKVRLLADTREQVKLVALQRDISEQRAEKVLQREKLKQAQWSQIAYNCDESDPSMYDLVINLAQINPDESIKTISGAVGYRKFQPMTYSTKNLAECALAAKVKTRLLENMNEVRVQVRDGRVVVTSKAFKRERQKKAAAIKEIAGGVEGVEFVEVHLINYVIREAAESFR
ncbi:MAG: cytidylate kinase family protein [Desulfobacteraceae bacterium]|nr:cytidylate kinase family protein [Desulfobacteraceae bacterium]